MGVREEGGSRPGAIVLPDAHRRPEAARSPVADFFFPPVSSSAARPGWDRVLVELHRVESWEGEACLPFHLVSLVLRPARRLVCRLDGGRARSIRPAVAECSIIPAGRSHWGSWEGHNEFLLAYVSPDTLAGVVRDDGLEADRFELDYGFQVHDPQLASLLLALASQLANSGTEDRLYVDTLGVQLGVHLLRRYGTTPLRLRAYPHGLSRAKMRVVLDYLNAYLDQNIHLADLAHLVEMSPFHFLRLFRLSCGKTPHQYLVERRVEVAKTILLREDVPLADVAYRVGFADQSHFTRHFRRITGAPPGRLRRERRPA
jgi:AraC family transcriptional regulator